MEKFEEEFNYLIELSGKVLTDQIEAEEFENHRDIFLKKYTPQPKPEIPQFVAEWLDRKSLYAINGPIPVGIIEWSQKQIGYADIGMNINHLLKLKVNGYTVAKKKLYKVVFPKSHSVLCKTGEVVSFAETVYEKYLLENAMTESEIKAIDERYWQFAVPVEEEV